MTSATRKLSASQSRISTSSTGLSSRASDANRSVTAAALSPRDTKTGVSCLACISLVPQVMGPCAVRDFTMEWHYMERFGKSSFNGSRNIGQRLVQNDAFERIASPRNASGLGSKKPEMPPSTVDQYDVVSARPGQFDRPQNSLRCIRRQNSS